MKPKLFPMNRLTTQLLFFGGVWLSAWSLFHLPHAHKPGEMTSALTNAIQQNDIGRVRTLLNDGVDIRTSDANRTPLLFRASTPEMVSLLLAKGADPSAKDSSQHTPAIVFANNPSILKILLDKGADVHFAMDTGETALFVAVGNEDTTRLLLDKGANANISNILGDTPLMEAARIGNIETVRILIAHGAKINAHSRIGLTPLLSAIVPVSHPYYGFRVHGSPQWEIHSDVVKYLIDRGATIDRESLAAAHALGIAIRRSDYRAVKLLLSLGVDVNTNLQFRSAAVEYALATRNTHALLWLLKPVRTPTMPINLATNNREILQLLLSKGAQINHRDENGSTVLLASERLGFQDLVAPVLEAIAGKRPIRPDLLRLLHIRNTLVRPNRQQVVDFLLKQHADPHIPDKYGFTPLMMAVLMGDASLAKRLLAQGVDPGAHTTQGIRASDLAHALHDPEMIKVIDTAPRKGAQQGPQAASPTGEPLTWQEP